MCMKNTFYQNIIKWIYEQGFTAAYKTVNVDGRKVFMYKMYLLISKCEDKWVIYVYK